MDPSIRDTASPSAGDVPAILDAVDRFLQRRLPPAEVRRRDGAHIPPYDLLSEMGELGLFALAVPSRYGGLGAPWTTVARVQERLGRGAYMAASLFNRVVGFGIATLIANGDEEQRRSLLPGLMAGELFCALALSEAGAGSDAAALTTLAERVPGGWRISGRKTWISDADAARYLVTPARTERGSTGPSSVTLFLVDRAEAGIGMSRLDKIGNNAMPSWDIGFEEVFVPDWAVLGEVGQGFRGLMRTLHVSRASMAATVTGAAQCAVDLAIAHCKERVQFGRPLSAFQVLRHRLVDMQMRVDASRLMVQRLAELIAAGEPCRREAAQAKIMASEALQYATHHGMQMLASAGYEATSDMQRLWRDGRLYSFGEGANELLRDLVARDLGLRSE
jgi:alkylation response protein AidB-like acyl-CoA dehydrogenase